jgi:hypothetical protein
MREKLTFGMILVSTKVTMRPMSPFWIAASAFTASMTSPEMRLTSASGASSAAKACVATSGLASSALVASKRDIHCRRCII